jgi:hypothetical protein
VLLACTANDLNPRTRSKWTACACIERLRCLSMPRNPRVSSWPKPAVPMSALTPLLGAKRTCGKRTENDANDPIVWTGRALQAESLEWQRLVLRFCIRPLHGADRSWPSWISARVRSHSRIGPRRPVGSPDHGRDGETVLHLLKSNSQTSAGVSY